MTVCFSKDRSTEARGEKNVINCEPARGQKKGTVEGFTVFAQTCSGINPQAARIDARSEGNLSKIKPFILLSWATQSMPLAPPIHAAITAAKVTAAAHVTQYTTSPPTLPPRCRARILLKSLRTSRRTSYTSLSLPLYHHGNDILYSALITPLQPPVSLGEPAPARIPRWNE